jgi:parvulin-like peptidyl-prolyl isomerase
MNTARGIKPGKSVSIKPSKSVSIAATALALFSLGAEGLAQTAPAAPRPAHAAPAKPKPAQAPAAAVVPAAQDSTPAKTASSDVVARVGDANLSANDIRAYVAALGPREQAALAQDPALLSQAVRMLLANRLVLQEVLAKKWDQQPGVTAQLERVRDSALVELYLGAVSAPPANYPSDDELQAAYDANRAAMVMPRQFQLAQVFIAGPKDAADKATEDKARKSLEEVQRQLKAPGADFGVVAGETGAKNGGDLGWLAEAQLRPEIRTQIIGLSKGAVSEPIRLDDGWHILKLIDTKASYTRTLPEVRDQLVQQMRSERAGMLRRAYLADLLKQNPPVVNELALSSLLNGQVGSAR